MTLGYRSITHCYTEDIMCDVALLGARVVLGG